MHWDGYPGFAEVQYLHLSSGAVRRQEWSRGLTTAESDRHGSAGEPLGNEKQITGKLTLISKCQTTWSLC